MASVADAGIMQRQLKLKTHSDDPVPFAVLSSQEWQTGTPRPVKYNESSAKGTGLVEPEAHRIMARFIHGQPVG